MERAVGGVALAAMAIVLALAPPARAQARDAIDFARAQRDCGKLQKVIVDHPDSEYAARAREVMREARCAAVLPKQEPCAQARARWATLRGSASSAALRGFLAETPAACLAERDAAQNRLDALAADADRARLAAEAREREKARLADQAKAQEQARKEEAAKAAELARRAEAAKTAPYDPAVLHPRVRDVVLRARAQAAQAETAATLARQAAIRGEAAAARARRNEPGTKVHTYNDGGRYEGEWSRGKPNGYGVWSAGRTQFAGDRFAGQHVDGVRVGAGVYTYGPRANQNTLRYEGEWSSEKANGVGVYWWRDGDRYAGGVLNWQRQGLGVYYFSDALRDESEWASDKRQGLGVRWSTRGEVLDAGVFNQNVLTTPLAP
ncbi:MAG: hypothetical protein NW200_07400 [Hyphomonadaceae bacterium]|nr:hypothetical protein [Hyphomonadaceae bacterium]